jgi:hypothetical protein
MTKSLPEVDILNLIIRENTLQIQQLNTGTPSDEPHLPLGEVDIWNNVFDETTQSLRITK